MHTVHRRATHEVRSTTVSACYDTTCWGIRSARALPFLAEQKHNYYSIYSRFCSMDRTFEQSNVRLLYRQTSKRRVCDVPPLIRPASLVFGTSLNSSTEVSISQRTYSVNTPEERRRRGKTKTVLAHTVIHAVAPKQTRVSYLSGRSTTTREPAPICVPFPIVMFPSRHAPAPISTPFPIWTYSAAFFICFQSQVFTAMDGMCMVQT